MRHTLLAFILALSLAWTFQQHAPQQVLPSALQDSYSDSAQTVLTAPEQQATLTPAPGATLTAEKRNRDHPTRTPRPTATPRTPPPPSDPGMTSLMIAFGMLAVVVVLFGILVNRGRSW